MLVVPCDVNDRYDTTIKGYQARKINELESCFLKFSYRKLYSAITSLRKVCCSQNQILHFNSVDFSGLITIHYFLVTFILSNQLNYPFLNCYNE